MPLQMGNWGYFTLFIGVTKQCFYHGDRKSLKDRVICSCKWPFMAYTVYMVVSNCLLTNWDDPPSRKGQMMIFIGRIM